MGFISKIEEIKGFGIVNIKDNGVNKMEESLLKCGSIGAGTIEENGVRYAVVFEDGKVVSKEPYKQIRVRRGPFGLFSTTQSIHPSIIDDQLKQFKGTALEKILDEQERYGIKSGLREAVQRIKEEANLEKAIKLIDKATKDETGLAAQEFIGRTMNKPYYLDAETTSYAELCIVAGKLESRKMHGNTKREYEFYGRAHNALKKGMCKLGFGYSIIGYRKGLKKEFDRLYDEYDHLLEYLRNKVYISTAPKGCKVFTAMPFKELNEHSKKFLLREIKKVKENYKPVKGKKKLQISINP